MPSFEFFKDEDRQEVLDYLESIDAGHFKHGLFTIILAYCQDNVEEGMHAALDRKFYLDMENLFNILCVRERYTDEKRQ
jgi:hypothetical protein